MESPPGLLERLRAEHERRKASYHESKTPEPSVAPEPPLPSEPAHEALIDVTGYRRTSHNTMRGTEDGADLHGIFNLFDKEHGNEMKKTGRLQLLAAQHAYNLLVPPQFHLQELELQEKIAKDKKDEDIQSLKALRQKMYRSLLAEYNISVEGKQLDFTDEEKQIGQQMRLRMYQKVAVLDAKGNRMDVEARSLGARTANLVATLDVLKAYNLPNDIVDDLADARKWIQLEKILDEHKITKDPVTYSTVPEFKDLFLAIDASPHKNEIYRFLNERINTDVKLASSEGEFKKRFQDHTGVLPEKLNLNLMMPSALSGIELLYYRAQLSPANRDAVKAQRIEAEADAAGIVLDTVEPEVEESAPVVESREDELHVPITLQNILFSDSRTAQLNARITEIDPNFVPLRQSAEGMSVDQIAPYILQEPVNTLFIDQEAFHYGVRGTELEARASQLRRWMRGVRDNLTVEDLNLYFLPNPADILKIDSYLVREATEPHPYNINPALRNALREMLASVTPEIIGEVLKTNPMEILFYNYFAIDNSSNERLFPVSNEVRWFLADKLKELTPEMVLTYFEKNPAQYLKVNSFVSHSHPEMLPDGVPQALAELRSRLRFDRIIPGIIKPTEVPPVPTPTPEASPESDPEAELKEATDRLTREWANHQVPREPTEAPQRGTMSGALANLLKTLDDRANEPESPAEPVVETVPPDEEIEETGTPSDQIHQYEERLGLNQEQTKVLADVVQREYFENQSLITGKNALSHEELAEILDEVVKGWGQRYPLRDITKEVVRAMIEDEGDLQLQHAYTKISKVRSKLGITKDEAYVLAFDVSNVWGELGNFKDSEVIAIAKSVQILAKVTSPQES